jgi:hypothetical protein
MKICRRAALATGASLFCMPSAAWCHSFDARYDLPAPLSYFVVGATSAVALSFAVTALFARHAPVSSTAEKPVMRPGRGAALLAHVSRAVAVALLVLTIVAGLYGTGDPMMNLAPTLVWIVFWSGLSLVVACIGNVWPALDPWRAIFDALDAVARRLGRTRGITLGWRYPRVLGAWPAAALLLAIGWLEVVYPQGAEPYRLACVLLGWSAFTLAGAVCFGRETWQRNVDVFAIYFAMLGRFAPFAVLRAPDRIVVRPYGRGLTDAPAASLAMVGFVLAMLATVLFDGLLSGDAWWAFQAQLTRAWPVLRDERGYVTGTMGLVGVWLVFFGGYLLSCLIATRMGGSGRVRETLLAFGLTLVPIAIAYNVAHNFSSLVMQGQQLIPLLSDPLGRQWDLFGTARYVTRLGLIDARTTWYVAIGAIVTGHVLSIWLAHRVALRELGTPRRAIAATAPLSVLMLAYTAMSLTIIAEPMVKFDVSTDSAMLGSRQAVRVACSSSAWCTRSPSMGC